MRLDHVSYVASHDQISDVVQRIGSQIGTAFVDGGIHPQFGTRNFTAPLLNGQYIEVVCALDHPAAEKTPFGQAVTKKAGEGGGWLTWVYNIENIKVVEAAFGRGSIEGHRRRPDGNELKWKQLGVAEIATDNSLPFFIQWLSGDHPSQNGEPASKIKNIEINGDSNGAIWQTLSSKYGENTPIIWVNESPEDFDKGIVSVSFSTPSGIVRVE